ncbi:MAG TPA: YcbK family protein [Caulobacteraceae bacterium]|nr:YcbK family protein [Caulobacteraceae bacterium]
MIARRSLLRTAIGVTGGLVGGSAAMALAAPSRRLSFNNLHTGETLDDVAYFENGAYVPDALTAVNHVLRDFRTGDVHDIEPKLLDLLVVLSASLDTKAPFGVISGYRSPQTNAMLHEHSSQVASGSLHMLGQAIDIRLAGVETSHIRDAALQLAVGGVGYYPTSDFVHVDVGRVRRWRGA